MKQFIVLAAVLPILLVFIAQFTLVEVRSLRMDAAGNAIQEFCLNTSYYDGGGASEIDSLRNKLASIFRTAPGEINIRLTQIDEKHIDWEVSFPVGDIMAAGPFMGLSSAENQGRTQINGTIVIAPKPSELLPPV